MSEHRHGGGGDGAIVSRDQLANDLGALAQRSSARQDGTRSIAVPAVRHERGCGAVRADQRQIAAVRADHSACPVEAQAHQDGDVQHRVSLDSGQH